MCVIGNILEEKLPIISFKMNRCFALLLVDNQHFVLFFE